MQHLESLVVSQTSIHAARLAVGSNSRSYFAAIMQPSKIGGSNERDWTTVPAGGNRVIARS